jgi:hypothetical protein
MQENTGQSGFQKIATVIVPGERFLSALIDGAVCPQGTGWGRLTTTSVIIRSATEQIAIMGRKNSRSQIASGTKLLTDDERGFLVQTNHAETLNRR